MIQAFGCIDGTHIPIKRPIVDSQDYFNYKQFFSLNVQAVCDFRGIFMDVDCRWPGCVHDAKVFANSNIHNELKAGNLPKTFNSLLPGYDKIPNYLIQAFWNSAKKNREFCRSFEVKSAAINPNSAAKMGNSAEIITNKNIL